MSSDQILSETDESIIDDDTDDEVEVYNEKGVPVNLQANKKEPKTEFVKHRGRVYVKAHNHLFWPIFYDLKVTFGCIGESPETFMSKYTQKI